MKKKSVKHLLHFMLLCMPLLLLLIACIFPTKQIQNTYALEETTTTQEYDYKYETNEINNFNDIVIGNIYLLDYYYIWDTLGYGLDDIFINLTLHIVGTYGIGISGLDTTNDGEPFVKNGYMIYDKLYLGFETISIGEDNNHGIYFYSPYYSFSFRPYAENEYIICRFIDFQYNNILTEAQQKLSIKICPQEYIPYDTINNITTGIYNQETLTQVNEIKQPNEAILMPYKTFYSLEVNNWYRSLLELIGVNISSTDLVQGYLLYFPLWAMWFWLFELIELAVTLVPKLVYDIYTKLSRSKDE